MDLVNEILRKNEELTQSIKLLRKNGEDLAEKERDYKIKLRQEALKLRAEKGMPVTLISQIIYGVPEVAELRFKRDCAEALYKANQEHIQVIKLQLRLLEAQVDREYGYKGDI
jgi:hypothetical protein